MSINVIRIAVSMGQRGTLSLRAPARVRADIHHDGGPSNGENVANWLQEVAGRPWVSGPPSVEPEILAEPPTGSREQAKAWHEIQNGRELVGLAALAVGWLQYYFLDAMVQIASLPAVIVFVHLGVA
jgi:hypothetical protein